MHEAAFARAALPAPTEVLGMVLRPYSLAHELYLQREAASTNSANLREALKTSVLICCQSWEELHGMRSDWLIGIKLAIWKWRLRKVNWEQQRLLFNAYRLEGSLEFPLPDTLRPRSGPAPRPPGSPFLLRLHQFLVVRLRLSQAEAWDYPLGLAKQQWASFWEEEGGLEIYNWQDAEHDAFVAKMEAEEAELAKLGPPATPTGEGGALA